MEQRIHVIVGHYGSGKTEFAINYALALKERFQKVYIVDLDIVNPYFRTNDVKEQLEQMGLCVIASPYASSNVDIPVLPAEITSVFTDKNAAVVFDVGGDDDGAVALGRYKRFFEDENPNMFFVINPCRPLTSEVTQIIEMIHGIEIVSRLKVTGLVNNANLAGLTSSETIIAGREITTAVAKETKIPFIYTAGLPELLKALPSEIEEKTFAIKRFLALTF